jgi:hypothetical protein
MYDTPGPPAFQVGVLLDHVSAHSVVHRRPVRQGSISDGLTCTDGLWCRCSELDCGRLSQCRIGDQMSPQLPWSMSLIIHRESDVADQPVDSERCTWPPTYMFSSYPDTSANIQQAASSGVRFYDSL